MTSENLSRILREHEEGVAARNNHPKSYLNQMIPYFRCINEGKLDEVPAPICIQVQVWSKCNTHCRMCEHWKERKNEMSLDEWKKVFRSISEFGVKTVIFSGGEPLLRPDIAKLLRAAAGNGLKIGLLTSGTMPAIEPDGQQEIMKAIAECVAWVAVSIDGTEAEDSLIRNPQYVNRIGALKDFCAVIREGNSPPTLSATVTLQKDNIHMDFYQVCKFIHDLGIPQVNFKLATGARQALSKAPEYLLEEKDLKDLSHFLFVKSLSHRDGNNLDYLRRAFEGDVFNFRDTADGVPLRTFYQDNSFRCYVPFVFSLIDSDGAVYPCCHLYRDNHGLDSMSKDFRRAHRMGNVTDSDFRFEEIWNNESYVKERQLLERIHPTERHDFLPCGECTRYCQHNRVLTKIHENYKNNLQDLEKAIKEMNLEDRPVWF